MILATETDSCLPEDLEQTDTPGVCWVTDLGRKPYFEAMEMQSGVLAQRKRDRIPDCLLLLEHPHTITFGRAGKRENLLVSEYVLRQQGVQFYVSDRGGDITYHGPGQLVAYPILDLKRQDRDIGRYLRRLEQCIIETLRDFGIGSQRVAGATGVWVGDRKIAAIGVRTSQWVTSHGLALNVNTDLSYFRFIVPCGLHNKGVTSLSLELGRPGDMDQVKDHFCFRFGQTFCKYMQPTAVEGLECS
jgi:lipoyl(octanoyl) transferase